jgi:hypothetical protein
MLLPFTRTHSPLAPRPPTRHGFHYPYDPRPQVNLFFWFFLPLTV